MDDCRPSTSRGFFDNENEYQQLNIIKFPPQILMSIFQYLSYSKISELRRVCQTFNVLGQQALNDGFNKIERNHSQISKRIKNQLPRRESERRSHYLSRHVDILTGIETRLSLLSMTYLKYIDSGACCFIPGKVLDELTRILRLIDEKRQLPRAHEFLLELRDISSMAMEHFDEKIQPTVKSQRVNSCMSLPVSFCSTPNNSPGLFLSSPAYSTPKRPDLIQLQEKIKELNENNLIHQREIKICQHETIEQKKKMLELERKIAENNRLITQQKSQIDELNKKSSQSNEKLNELLKRMLPEKANIEKSYCDKTVAAEKSESSSSSSNQAGRGKRKKGYKDEGEPYKTSTKRKRQ